MVAIRLGDDVVGHRAGDEAGAVDPYRADPFQGAGDEPAEVGLPPVVGELRRAGVGVVVVLQALTPDEPGADVVVAGVVRGVEVAGTDGVPEGVDDPALYRVAHDAQEAYGGWLGEQLGFQPGLFEQLAACCLAGRLPATVGYRWRCSRRFHHARRAWAWRSSRLCSQCWYATSAGTSPCTQIGRYLGAVRFSRTVASRAAAAER